MDRQVKAGSAQSSPASCHCRQSVLSQVGLGLKDRLHGCSPGYLRAWPPGCFLQGATDLQANGEAEAGMRNGREARDELLREDRLEARSLCQQCLRIGLTPRQCSDKWEPF